MKQRFLSTLQYLLKILAGLTVRRYDPGIIAITGSVGKTSAKDAIYAVLKNERRTRVSRKNFNNELGVPLTILGDWEDTGGALFWIGVLIRGAFRLIVRDRAYPEVLILEYGVDRPGDMKRLLSIARPHIGVFTAMGDIPSHVEFFMGPEGIFSEKSKLFTSIPATGFAVLNADDPQVLKLREHIRAQTVAFGFSSEAEIRAVNHSFLTDSMPWGISFKITKGGSTVPVQLRGVLGKAQIFASLAAAAVGSVFGLNLVKIAEALSSEYAAPVGRLRVVPGVKDTVILDDTYNASPIAMREALETLKSVPAKRRIAVLGDMLEIGKYTVQAHEGIGHVAAKTAQLLITVGLRGKFIAEAVVKAGLPRRSVFSFMDVREAGLFLQEKMRKGDVILVKASQGVRLERIVKEVMAEPLRAPELLARQSDAWERKPGLYDAGSVPDGVRQNAVA